MPNFYITTPIYYVNSVPHIGTLYTTVAADVVARFKRLSGAAVKFVTGTDEHGQKIERAAEAAGAASPQAFTDSVAAKFADLFGLANISNDDFIRTTQERHKLGAIAFWNRLQANGHIYLDKYSGWYAVSDEAFYAESEIVDGKAPTGSKVEWVSEESYFFGMSKWQDKLLEFYEANPDFITPRSRANEVINMVKAGLPDLSVSRTAFKWGIPVPGNAKHVMYVWVDALTNYLTVLGYPNESAPDFEQFWPANAHFVGKDIIKFHAIYWPAMLMAAGLPLPKQIVSHGWWTVKGSKMSKSLKNVVDPVKLIESYGVDAVRYYLMREISFGADGEFSEENLVARANSELSNKIGNLAQRTLVLAYRNCDGRIPAPAEKESVELSSAACGGKTYAARMSSCVERLYVSNPMLQTASQLRARLEAELADYRINQMLEHIASFADELNGYIDKSEPWKLKHTDEAAMREVLYVILESLRFVAILLQPFVPDSAGKLLDQLKVPTDQRNFDALSSQFALQSAQLDEPTAVFPRLELATEI